MAATSSLNPRLTNRRLKMLSFLIAVSVLSMVHAECPSPADLPVKYSSTKFLCARVWTDTSAAPSNACSGRYRSIANGGVTTFVGNDLHDQISALVVRPGCKLLAFQHPHFGGGQNTYTGSHYRLGGWDDMISSWDCFCEFSNTALTCRPEEKYIVIKTCKNPSPGAMKCEHAVSKGTQIGQTVTKGKTVSESVTVTIAAALEEVFMLSLSASTKTSFDWSKADSETFSKTTTTTVTCSVEPGKSVNMVQVIGKCGDTTVYTSQYECQES